jgi:hypothetical protein
MPMRPWCVFTRKSGCSGVMTPPLGKPAKFLRKRSKWASSLLFFHASVTCLRLLPNRHTKSLSRATRARAPRQETEENTPSGLLRLQSILQRSETTPFSSFCLALSASSSRFTPSAFSSQIFAFAAFSASRSTTTSSWQTSTGTAPGHSLLRSCRRASDIYKYANQRGAKSAKSPSDTLLALLAPHHPEFSRNTRPHAEGRRARRGAPSMAHWTTELPNRAR